MQYKIVRVPGSADYLEISHGSDKMEFDVASLLSKNTNIETMFFTLNKYLDSLNAFRQNGLFEILSEFYIHKNRNVDYSKEKEISYLEKVLDSIVKLIAMDDVTYWMLYKQRDVVLPDNLAEVFVYDPDMNVTEEKTYVKPQYVALISLLQVIKICMPILGEYNNYVKEISKQSLHKTFLLLINTSLYEESEMRKLRVYVDEIQNTTKSQAGNKIEQYVIHKGICSDDIIDNIVAEILLNKLLNADLYNPKSNVISVIFQTIKAKSNPTTSDGDIIRMKSSVKPTGEDVSYFEDYRRTTSFPVGTVAGMQFSFGQVEKIIRKKKAEAYFDQAFYESELIHSHDMLEYPPDDTQIYLLGWFLGCYSNPRSLFYIERNKIIELLTIARVISWNKGQKFISLLLTSCRSANAKPTMNLGTKTTLSLPTQAKLEEVFSFFYDRNDRDNEIEKSILGLHERIVSTTWFTNANMLHVLEYNNDNKKGNRKLSLPINLTDVLADFAIN